MLRRIVLALVVGIAVALVCILGGLILAATDIEVITTVGVFLKRFAGLIGLLAAIWYFFAGPRTAV